MVVLRDVAVLHRQLGCVLGDIAEHGAQILEVEQQQALLVGDAEGDVEHALLHVVEVHQARQQQRPDLRNGGADRMALLPEKVPEDHRKLVGLVVETDRLRARDECLLGLARFGDARQIALDVGGEHRHAGARQPFGQHLQRHRLAGAGRAGHQTVPVGQGQCQEFGLGALADEDFAVLIHVRHLRAVLRHPRNPEGRGYSGVPRHGSTAARALSTNVLERSTDWAPQRSRISIGTPRSVACNATAPMQKLSSRSQSVSLCFRL